MEQQFIEYVVRNLVDNEDAVKVKRSEDARGVLLELSVAPEDLGRVIGRNGVIAQSLRSILRALGIKNHAHYNLKIIETDQAHDQAEDQDEKDVAPQNDSTVDTVEKTNTENVENITSRAEKLREELADLDDFDI